jgi:serine protease Do
MDLPDEKGALVSKVVPDGPAEAAGIKHGDVIIEFGGTAIDSWNDLPRVVAGTPVGETIEVVVMRGGKRKTLEAKVEALDEGEAIARAEEPSEGTAAFGLRVQDLSPEIAKQLDVEGDTGVLVTAVEPGSPAEVAGLRRGDLILEVDRSEVSSTGDLQERLAAAGDRALLLVRRGDATIFVPLKRGDD